MDDDPDFTTPGDAVREAMEKLEWTQPDLAYVLGTTTATA
jgi:plasmid maintenance system antidote protein VapI